MPGVGVGFSGTLSTPFPNYKKLWKSLYILMSYVSLSLPNSFFALGQKTLLPWVLGQQLGWLSSSRHS